MRPSGSPSSLGVASPIARACPLPPTRWPPTCSPPPQAPKSSTIARKRAAIRAMHRQRDLPLPALDASARAAVRGAAAPKPQPIELAARDARSAVDQNGIVLDILVQSRRETRADKRLLGKLKWQCRTPRVTIADKLASYGAAKHEMMPTVEHMKHKGLNKRCKTLTSPCDDASGRRNIQVSRPSATISVRSRWDRRPVPPPS